MYLLDTNICIAILKENYRAVEHFKLHFQQCYLPSLVLAELYKGVYCSTKVNQNLEVLSRFIHILPTIEFNNDDAWEFGKIQGELRKKGQPTGVVDALLAAMARSRQNILVTDNTKHFINISDLHLENWLI
jgi:tRNA(fMet)-specific endonuclease VapC